MISEARANAVLGYEFGLRPFVPASTYWLGVSFNPIVNGSGYAEPDVITGYKRIPISNNTTTWSVPANHTVTNLAQFTFAPFTANQPDGKQATYWFICESETGDTAIYYGLLEEPRPIISSSQIWIDVGDLKIERTNQS